MRNEIAVFLLDQNPVTEATLQLVVDHINSSPSWASCVCRTVLLQFVFGAEQSFAVFLQVWWLPVYFVDKMCLKTKFWNQTQFANFGPKLNITEE